MLLQWQCKAEQRAAGLPVFRLHRAAVRLHNAHADRKPDAHIPPAVRRQSLVVREIALEELRKNLSRDALSVVRDLKSRALAIFLQLKLHARGRPAVLDGVFHQIDEHLLNQNHVHRDHQQLLRRVHGNVDIRIVLFDLHGGGA